MDKTDKEVLELCKAWFEDIMERCDRLTSGNVSHGSRAIHGVAKNYAEYIGEQLHNRWKPSDEEMKALGAVVADAKYKNDISTSGYKPYMHLYTLLQDLKKLREE